MTVSHDVTFLTDRVAIKTAIHEVLHAESKPRRVRILTFTIGPFELDGGVSFERQLRKLLVYGAEVTMIVGKDPADLEPDQREMLKRLDQYGARLYHRSTLHAKMILAEGVKWQRMFLGSANMTSSAMETLDELGVRGVAPDPTAYSVLTEYFNRKVSNPATKALAPLLG